jgi:large subunit ribosomal protein L5e
MPFVKVIKNKSYSKTFQVKFRRRREGKTDYRQRHKLITQDKNKYQTPKYRFVVRFSNKYVTCQVIYAEINGDKILCSAHSRELSKYGLTTGLKNYAAAYATGLLLARRLLKQLGLDEIYQGSEEPNGDAVSKEVVTEQGRRRTYFVNEVDEEKKPFRCLLDVGIKNTTTGAKIFGALKGASDGGLDIPHSNKRFPGYNRDAKSFDAAIHKSRIMGEHIADYMREMEEDDEDNFKKHFAAYLDADIDADGVEELYEKVHAAIREDPTRDAKPKFNKIDKSFRKPGKKTYEQRKSDAAAKKATFKNDGGAAVGDDDEEDDEDA